tara:strand:+ start:438 stop:1028 length:591 start_codon:yes stop_codon:yes gene_type:complete
MRAIVEFLFGKNLGHQVKVFKVKYKYVNNVDARIVMTKTNTEDNLNKILDIEPANTVEEVMNMQIGSMVPAAAPIPAVIDDNNAAIDEDYNYARGNLKNIIDNGMDSLDTLKQLAMASQSPRAFEVLGQLIKTLSETNQNLMKLQKDVKDLKGTEIKGPNSVTNALFVGNTAELQKLIKQRKDVNTIEADDRTGSE